jgi:hypothetical protein
MSNKTYDTGDDSWRHGDKRGHGRDDWHVFLGPCPVCGKRTFDYGGGWRCVGEYCSKGTSNPSPSVGATPDWWGTNINVMKDGNAWEAHYDGFTEFGDTPQEAVDKLRKEIITDTKLRGNDG